MKVIPWFLRTYWRVFRIGLQDALAYRWHVFFEVMSHWIVAGVVLLIWYYLPFDGSFGIENPDWTREQILLYVLLANVVVSGIHVVSAGDDITRMINQGELTFFLVRPFSTPMWFWVYSLSIQLVLMLFALIGGGFFAVVLDLPLELVEWKSVLMALPFVAIGVAVNFFVFYTLGGLSFWLKESWGVRLLMRVMLDVASGAVIPLALFPLWASSAFSWLPFRFLGDVPVRVLLGQLGGVGYWMLLGVGLVWVAVLFGLFQLVWRRGIRSYEAVGA